MPSLGLGMQLTRGLGGLVAIPSLTLDTEANPAWTLTASAAGTLAVEFDTGASDPGVGLGDTNSWSIAIDAGSYVFEDAVQLDAGVTGYLHFRLTNAGGTSPVVTSTQFTAGSLPAEAWTNGALEAWTTDAGLFYTQT